jgi:Mn-dependent DtxR family transcriptional regulator
LSDEFFTFREYMKKGDALLTASMEDYLEMIYRLAEEKGYTKLNALAAALNVQPSSASRMVQKLADIGMVDYEKYGVVSLSKEGEALGKSLLERHRIVEGFLRIIGMSQDLLEETEKIEHTISNRTLFCMAKLVNFFQARPDLLKEYQGYDKTSGDKLTE